MNTTKQLLINISSALSILFDTMPEFATEEQIEKEPHTRNNLYWHLTQ